MTLEEFKEFVSKVRDAASGQWIYLLESLAPSIPASIFGRPGKEKGACPVHPGKTERNFRAFSDVNETGGCACHSCGVKPDGFAVLQWVNGWTFAEAVKEVNDKLGGVSHIPQSELDRQAAERAKRAAVAKQAQAAEDKRLRRNLNDVWRASLPLDHPAAEPARKYFASRGLPAVYPRELRFHPALTYWDFASGKDLGKHPAIVARFRTANGMSGSLHRIYLTPDGQKFGLGDAKKMMPHPSDTPLAGGAIRLSTTTPRILCVAEGIETALAASALHGFAVWACYSASLLETFMPPAGVEKVIIFADLDVSGTGEKAAKKLQARLWEMGIMAGIRLPDGPIPYGAKGVDWNDILVEQQPLRKVA